MYAAFNGYPQVVKLLLGKKTLLTLQKQWLLKVVRFFVHAKLKHCCSIDGISSYAGPFCMCSPLILVSLYEAVGKTQRQVDDDSEHVI